MDKPVNSDEDLGREVRLMVTEEIDRWKDLHDRELARRKHMSWGGAVVGALGVLGIGVSTFRSTVASAASSAVNASKGPYLAILSEMREEVQDATKTVLAKGTEMSEAATRTESEAHRAEEQVRHLAASIEKLQADVGSELQKLRRQTSQRSSLDERIKSLEESLGVLSEYVDEEGFLPRARAVLSTLAEHEDATTLIADFKELESAASKAIPLGTVVAWPGPVPPVEDGRWHESWHVCDGAELAVGDYHELLDAFGGLAAWPHGSGQGTIKLPDIRGRFLRSSDEVSSAGELGGTARIPSGGSHAHTGSSVAQFSYDGNPTDRVSNGMHTIGRHKHDVAIALDGNHDHGGNNLPPYFTVHWIIRVK